MIGVLEGEHDSHRTRFPEPLQIADRVDTREPIGMGADEPVPLGKEANSRVVVGNAPAQRKDANARRAILAEIRRRERFRRAQPELTLRRTLGIIREAELIEHVDDHGAFDEFHGTRGVLDGRFREQAISVSQDGRCAGERERTRGDRNDGVATRDGGRRQRTDGRRWIGRRRADGRLRDWTFFECTMIFPAPPTFHSHSFTRQWQTTGSAPTTASTIIELHGAERPFRAKTEFYADAFGWTFHGLGRGLCVIQLMRMSTAGSARKLSSTSGRAAP